MSTPKTFLIIGKTYVGIESTITKRGDDFLVLKDSVSASASSSPHEVRVDFANPQALEKAIERLRGTVDGVVCIYENYVVPTAQIAKQMGLPGMPLDSAQKCTNKYLMRQAFAAAPQDISAKYSLIENEKSLLAFAQENGYPLIIKPASLTKSLLVTKNLNQTELLKNYRKTLEVVEDVYKRYGAGNQPQLLVEEFLEGPAHSVDAFVDSSGKAQILKEIVDYQTGYDIGYDDNFHYSRRLPTKLKPEQQIALLDVAELGIKALGMRSSPAHVEIIYTKAGPRIIEIGARNGGYRERMYRLANGIEIYDLALELSLGKRLTPHAIRHQPCAVLELFPKKAGKFVGINEMSALKKLPSLVSVALKHKVGEFVGKSSEGYKMCAIIILHSSDPTQFQKDLEFVNKSVFVITN